MAEPKALESSLTKLTLNPQASKASASFAKKNPQPLADSWEDEASGSDNETSTSRPLSAQQSADYPSAPPPTPSSPTAFRSHNFASPYGYTADAGTERTRGDRERRPEKTDAVAKRMIAGALGVKAPKKTEEQRLYERAIMEKEVKRREQEKEGKRKEEESARKAKAAIWED